MQPIVQEFPIHSSLVLSEDCLLLNIWSPKCKYHYKKKLLPVMVWFYGGVLIMGSIYQLPHYNGSALASHDVVIVTVNYRVGAFGFLYGGDKTAPGNQGLYDQILALKWV